MIRHYRGYAPTTPIINIKTASSRFRANMIEAYGYTYNQTTVDENIFTRIAEETYDL